MLKRRGSKTGSSNYPSQIRKRKTLWMGVGWFAAQHERYHVFSLSGDSCTSEVLGQSGETTLVTTNDWVIWEYGEVV